MAAILYKAWEGYHFLFEELADPRTKSWPLVSKPYQGLFLLGLYIMFVLKWGPKWMRNRPAFNLDKVLILYNAFQVIACAYLFYMAIYHAWGWDYKWVCEPVDHSNSPKGLITARIVYFYFILKVMDLLDTVFFVLRKKFNQISFLHIYHHTGMVLLIWGAVTYLPGGHGTLVGVINCFIHTVMYSYYLLTIIQPSYKQSFWWKKHITQLQILQFFLNVIHMGVIVFKPDCGYPRWVSAVFLPQNLFMLVLFVDFYIKAYVRKPTLKETGTKRTESKPNRLDDDEMKHANEHINQKTNEFNDFNGLTNGKIDGNDSTRNYSNVGVTEFDDNIEYVDVNMSHNGLTLSTEDKSGDYSNCKNDRKTRFSHIIDKSDKYKKHD